MNDDKDLPESCLDKPYGVQLGTSRVESADEDPGDDIVVGIDLGTTFSLVATVDGEGKPQCLSGLVPSIVYFPEGEDQSPLVGDVARDRAVGAPQRTIFSVKRLMGKGLDEVDSELKLVPYSVVDRDQKMVVVRVGDRDFTPQEISALILRQVRELAERQLERPVSKAVVTVPAYFDDSQRQATRDAGRIAGLDVLRIVNEPTAAALAYGLHEGRDGVIAVYDLGGGTFDCSILRISGGVFQVLSTNGDTRLGGDDFDQAIMEIVLPELQEQLGSDPAADPVVLQSVRLAAVAAKHTLSSKATAGIHVSLDGLEYDRQITRDEFEARIAALVERSLDCCGRALKDAGLSADQVEEVVLVGGSTRVPLVRQRVEELFGRAPHTELDPDQVVALGAAVQAHILSGKTTDYLLLDVTPLSLGIETFGGAVSKLIMRNSTVPARANEEFTTFVEGQVSVDIHILQGEREMASDCRSLGKFKLSGIPPMPSGVPRIDVTFLIDESGILTVSALEKRSGKSASVEVLPSHGLTEDEVRRMVSDSIDYAQEDVQAHRLVSLRNEAETMLRATDGAVERHRQVLDEVLVASITKASDELRALVAECDDADRLHRASEALNEATKPLADVVLRVAVTGESS